MMNKTIVIIAGRRKSANIIYNSLKENFRIEKVILENPVSKFKFLKRRIRKFGFPKVLGQILFQLIAIPYLKILSYRRIMELKKSFGLIDTPIDMSKIINVASVNSEKTMVALKDINPDIVIVSGTRIISDKVLGCISAKFINMHAGITPLYRGVHGAYWALVENNKKACGATVHLVDTGIDTGGILEQEVIDPKREDNIVTYPLLQLAAGIPLLKKAIKDVFENRIEIKPYPAGASRLRTHPTLWEYIRHRIRFGVK